MYMILFINACVREHSRTKILADHLLSRLNQPVTEIRLKDVTFPIVNDAFLKHRDKLIETSQFNHPLFDNARLFAEADDIVIAAPYWDLSFPASLKQFFEQINVVGITFRYSPEGIPEGLCHAKRLYYISTAGGHYVPNNYGFDYVKALSQAFYGIQDVRLYQAAGLDIIDADVQQILQETIQQIDSDQ